jgi:hypothetical protein
MARHDIDPVLRQLVRARVTGGPFACLLGNP